MAERQLRARTQGTARKNIPRKLAKSAAAVAAGLTCFFGSAELFNRYAPLSLAFTEYNI